MINADHLPPLSGRMPSVCMTCKQVYGEKPCIPEHDGKPSHGYCPTCFLAVKAELERLPRVHVLRPLR